MLSGNIHTDINNVTYLLSSRHGGGGADFAQGKKTKLICDGVSVLLGPIVTLTGTYVLCFQGLMVHTVTCFVFDRNNMTCSVGGRNTHVLCCWKLMVHTDCDKFCV